MLRLVKCKVLSNVEFSPYCMLLWFAIVQSNSSLKWNEQSQYRIILADVVEYKNLVNSVVRDKFSFKCSNCFLYS